MISEEGTWRKRNATYRTDTIKTHPLCAWNTQNAHFKIPKILLF